VGLIRFHSVARNKGELLHRQRLLEQAYAEVHRELVHVLTVQARTHGRSERLRKLVRDLEARMIALERQKEDVHAGLMADVSAMRRPERVALWSA
jgi:hypothetical protein